MDPNLLALIKNHAMRIEKLEASHAQLVTHIQSLQSLNSPQLEQAMRQLIARLEADSWGSSKSD